MGQFLEIEIYASYERAFLKIFGWDTFENLESEGCKKIAFKAVQMKFLAMAYYKSNFKFWDIYGRKFTKYLHGTWSLLNILMIFGIKEKSIILSVATNKGYPWYLWLALWSRVTYKNDIKKKT